MPTLVRSLALSLSISCVACAISPFSAARAADEAPRHGKRAEDFQKHLEEISARLNLTPEQKTAIAPILQKQAAELREVHQDTSLRRREKLTRTRDILSSAQAGIRALLTPEQQPVYDAIIAEAKERVRERARDRRSPSAPESS